MCDEDLGGDTIPKAGHGLFPSMNVISFRL